MLVQLVMLLVGPLGLPAWALQLILTLLPQLEAQIPKAKLEELVRETALKIAKDVAREAPQVAQAIGEWLKAHPGSDAQWGPPDLGGNKPADIDWGPNPTGPAKPPPDEDFQS